MIESRGGRTEWIEFDAVDLRIELNVSSVFIPLLRLLLLLLRVRTRDLMSTKNVAIGERSKTTGRTETWVTHDFFVVD